MNTLFSDQRFISSPIQGVFESRLPPHSGGLVFPELLESRHHVCSGYRLRLSSVLDPSLNQLLNELLVGVHGVCQRYGSTGEQ